MPLGDHMRAGRQQRRKRRRPVTPGAHRDDPAMGAVHLRTSDR
ncbi:MAG: hypothetical protein ACRDZO_11815 [Egibacteraceae bacterium]